MKRKFFVVTAIIISSHLHAQDSTTTNELDEVIVTANKWPQKQSSTGKVISIIPRTQIEQSGAKSLSQLLNDQAGITVNGAFNNTGSNQTLYVRGAGQGRTLVLVDGVPLYDPSLINSEFDLNLVSLPDIERIEICKGAQSTLYGSDAIAGVINIITINNNIKKPINLRAAIGIGSFRNFRSHAQLFGKISKLQYYVKLSRLNNDGFSAAYDSSGTAEFERDSYRGRAIGAGIIYQWIPSLSTRIFYQNNRNRTGIDAAAFQDENDQNVKNQNLLTGFELNYQKNKFRLTGRYQYSEAKRNFLNDSVDVPGFSKYSTDDYYGKNQFIELFSSIKVGKNIELVQGIDYRYSSMNSAFFSLSSFGPFSSQFKDTFNTQSSIYFSGIFHSNNEKLNIEAGGRFNNHSRYGNNLSFTFNPSFSISKNYRVFGSVASAFKAPSLYQLYAGFGNKDLQPEYSTNIEFGVQQSYKIFRNRIVVFQRIIKDGLDFDNLKFQFFNINKQKVAGIEVESNIQPVRGISIAINYTYLHSKENSQSRISFKDSSYNYLLRRPAHSANYSVGYQINRSLFVSTTGKYLSKRYDVGGYKADDVLLNSYFIVGAYAEYKFGSHTCLYVDAQNITNKKFFDVRGYNSIPFLFFGGVRFQW